MRSAESVSGLKFSSSSKPFLNDIWTLQFPHNKHFIHRHNSRIKNFFTCPLRNVRKLFAPSTIWELPDIHYWENLALKGNFPSPIVFFTNKQRRVNMTFFSFTSPNLSLRSFNSANFHIVQFLLKKKYISFSSESFDAPSSKIKLNIKKCFKK